MMLNLRSKTGTFQRILNLGILLLLVLTLFVPARPGLAATLTPGMKIGLITDGGPVDDRSFNQMAYEGLTRAETDLNMDGTVYIPTCVGDTCDYEQKISDCATSGNELCITVGFQQGDATLAAATANPGVNFAILDYTYDSYPSNLRGAYFAVDQAAYLAGTMAGLVSENKKIGIVGGMDIPPVNNFILPYIYGAQWADRNVYAIKDYANDFSSEAIGAALAQAQIDQGADVIFGVGGQMGNGAVKKAAELGKWVVGVDVDTYYTVFEGGTVTGSDKLLTSVLKKLDVAVFDTILDQKNGLFTSGSKEYNIANDGVGLAPYHGTAGAIPADVQDAVNTVASRISSGATNVWDPFWREFAYLPLTTKK